MRIISFLCGLGLIAGPAAAETRNFGVSGFERVRVEGPFKVKLGTGVAPFAKASGPAAALARLDIKIEGRTLIVQSIQSGWGGYPGKDNGPVEVTIGTHELERAALVGAGSLHIDKVKSFEFLLTLQGAGIAAIEQADVDRMKVVVTGSGGVTLGGKARQLDAVLRGMSTLQAAKLTAKNATFAVAGPASVTATVTDSVNVTGSGSGNVALDGKPACTVKVTGSGRVSGCREGR